MRRAPVALAALALLAAAPAARPAAVPNTWTPARPMLDAVSGASWAGLPDGRVLVVGGRDSHDRYVSEMPRPVAEAFDPRHGTWSAVADPGIVVPGSVRAVGLADGRMLAVGTNPVSGDPLGFSHVARVYDPASDAWTDVAGPQIAEWFAVLADGRVLGVGRGSGTSTQFSIWDPQTDSSTPVGDAGGALGPLTRLPDGRVLATGGNPGAFDPAIGAWTSAPPPAMLEGATVRLADGRVLVTGADGRQGLAYDGGKWRKAGASPLDVLGSATLLADGRVLAFETVPVLHGRAYLYDPALRRWFRAASSRGDHTQGVTARLADGRILAAGGYSCFDDCFDPVSGSEVEIYNPPPRRPVIERALFSGGARPRFFDVRLNERVSMTLTLRTPGKTRGIVALGRSLRWRLGGRLRPGRWTLTVTAKDAFGRRARTLRVTRTVR